VTRLPIDTIRNSAAAGGPEPQRVAERGPTASSGARSSAIVPSDFGTKDDALSATAYTVTHDPAHAGLLDDLTVITGAATSHPCPHPAMKNDPRLIEPIVAA
jgi:hypothetical protein